MCQGFTKNQFYTEWTQKITVAKKQKNMIIFVRSDFTNMIIAILMHPGLDGMTSQLASTDIRMYTTGE